MLSLDDLLAAAAIRAANDRRLSWPQMVAVMNFLKFYAFNHQAFVHVTSRHIRALLS